MSGSLLQLPFPIILFYLLFFLFKSSIGFCSFLCSDRGLILDIFQRYVKFILTYLYSEKAKKFCWIFPLLLTTVHPVKSKGKISQNLVAFSEYMNFNMPCVVYKCQLIFTSSIINWRNCICQVLLFLLVTI